MSKPQGIIGRLSWPFRWATAHPNGKWCIAAVVLTLTPAIVQKSTETIVAGYWRMGGTNYHVPMMRVFQTRFWDYFGHACIAGGVTAMIFATWRTSRQRSSPAEGRHP